MSREPIPKMLRFEVFKRDAFTCQYCGAKAPEAVLQCDHIKPVAAGGETSIMNLVTSCVSCNLGKGPRELSEQHVMQKQRAQLEELNERRNQLEMLADWQRELSKLGDYQLAVLEERWRDICAGAASMNEDGRDYLRRWLKRFSEEEIMRCMVESASTYFQRGDDGQFTRESMEKAFEYVPRVAMVRRSEAERPYLKRLYYIRGILRNRLSYLREQDALELMEEAVEAGIDIDSLEHFAKRVRSWSAFRRSLEQFIEEERSGENP